MSLILTPSILPARPTPGGYRIIAGHRLFPPIIAVLPTLGQEVFWKRRRVNAHAGNGTGAETEQYHLSVAEWANENGGPVLRFPTVASYMAFGWNTPSWLPTGPVTVVLGYRKVDATNRASVVCGVTGVGDTKRLQIALPHSDGIIYWDYGGASGNNRLSISAATMNPSTEQVWAFTNGPRGMEIWRGGVRVANSVTEVSRAAGADDDRFFLGRSQSVTASDLASIRFFYLYDRQLTTAELRMLAAQPFPFVAPVITSFTAQNASVFPSSAMLSRLRIGVGVGVGR